MKTNTMTKEKTIVAIIITIGILLYILIYITILRPITEDIVYEMQYSEGHELIEVIIDGITIHSFIAFSDCFLITTILSIVTNRFKRSIINYLLLVFPILIFMMCIILVINNVVEEPLWKYISIIIIAIITTLVFILVKSHIKTVTKAGG